MGQRLELHELLVRTVGPNAKVYFQPPENLQMSYPCVVYERARSHVDHADNVPYHIVKQYTVTVMDRNPDSHIPDEIARLPMCTHSTFFKVENLNHDVYDIYF